MFNKITTADSAAIKIILNIAKEQRNKSGYPASDPTPDNSLSFYQ